MTDAAFPDLAPLPAALTDRAILARMRIVAASGIFRHALPESVGGYGDRFSDLRTRHRQLGYESRDPGLVLAVNAHLWGAIFPVFLFGTDDQKRFLLPALIRGEWWAGHAITETGAGSDVQAITTRAEREADAFRLNGEKCYITNAPVADWLVVYGKLEGRITAFLVSTNDGGCRFTGGHAIQACRGGTLGRVVLEDCRIGDDRLLGKPGGGASIMQRALELERAFVFAGIAGVMEWQLDKSIEYSRVRRSGGAHLGRHQAISHRLADMKLRLDTVDLWVSECARLCDDGRRLTLAAAETKLYAAEAFLQSSLDAVQIFGAAGLEEDAGMAGLVQDAMAGRLFSGSSEVQKNIIAAVLGTGDGYRNPYSRRA